MRIYSIVSDLLHMRCIIIHRLLTIYALCGYCGCMIKKTFVTKHHHHLFMPQP
ncbi:MAG: hypothetical protein M0Q37_10995 [Sphaerochaeta sp.]|nr:hypothetical protein [Sphaerochaeta sp.]